MRVFVFFKTGYEDADYDAFCSRDEAAGFIQERTDANQISGDGFQVIAVVEGEELNTKIVARQTTVTFI